LTDSGRFTLKVVTRPAVSLAQDRESSPARTSGLTIMLRQQLRQVAKFGEDTLNHSWAITSRRF